VNEIIVVIAPMLDKRSSNLQMRSEVWGETKCLFGATLWSVLLKEIQTKSTSILILPANSYRYSSRRTIAYRVRQLNYLDLIE
jgi:hypothetical protein